MINIVPPFELADGSVRDKFGFSPHHLIPGNEIWNNKGHPLHEWIHKDKGKVKGDIGYINNAKYNGIDLPSNYKFSSWSEAVSDQVSYAFAAMEADSKKRQFHDAPRYRTNPFVWFVNYMPNILKTTTSSTSPF